jgi:hypothetical protein
MRVSSVASSVLLFLALQEGGQRHTVYFPTPSTVSARVDKATELGVGIGIWDIGQGLDSFLDLL